MTDALLLARSVRHLCTRHRSDLALSVSGGSGSGNEEEKAAIARLWVNDQLSHVRGREVEGGVGGGGGGGGVLMSGGQHLL